MGWSHTVKIKHLFSDAEDWETVQDEMNAIADILDKSPCFSGFNTTKFRAIPKGDDFFSPTDYANKLLDAMYNFADYHRIWIA